MINIQKRKTLKYMGAMAGATLCAPAVHTQEVKLLRIVMPTFDADLKMVEDLLNVKVLSFEFVSYENHYETYNKLAQGEYLGDIIIGSTFNNSRLFYKKMLKQIDFNNIPKYTKPNYTLVGRGSTAEFDYIVPVGILYKSFLINELTLKNKFSFNYNDIFEATMGVQAAIWNGDIYEVVKMASLALGYGYNVLRPYRSKITEYILVNKRNFVMNYNPYKLLLNKQVNLISASSSTIYNVFEKSLGIKLCNYYPSDGVQVEEVSFAIPKNSRNPMVAEKFINYMFQPTVRTSILQYGRMTSRLKTDYGALPINIKTNQILYPNFRPETKFFENFYTNEDSYQLMTDIYFNCFT